MSIIKTAVKRPVATIMAILVVMAFGILSIFNLNMDMMPNMDIPYAIVSTSYSGTGPAEMESLITEPLESALGTVSGIKSIESITSYGSSIVMLEFETGTNIDMAALDMRERIDMVKGMLPDGATDPMVMKLDMNAMVSLSIGISSETHDLVSLKSLVEDNIVDRLKRQNGVASVNLAGGREKEVSVIIREDKLRGYGISEAQITSLLRMENTTTPTGTIKQGDKKLQLRITGEFKSLDDIRNLPITTPMGVNMYLRDIADIEETYKESSSFSYDDGRPSVSLSIQKQSTANVVKVSDAVNKELEKIKIEYPDLKINVFMDPADMIKSTLSSVISSAGLGGVLAVIVLYLFLRNIRSTLVIALAMPVSIVSTFILMYYTNITLNVMSLGGLALGMGLLLDNSIVVLESIYRKLEAGEDRISAAVDGTSEVAMAIVSSTLTTVAVFLPISFAGGLVAQIFNQLSMTIAFSLLSSLIVSITLVPMASSLFLKVESEENKKGILSAPLNGLKKVIEGTERLYANAITKVLKRRKTTLLVSMVFFILTLGTIPFIGMEFMPSTDESAVDISISMPKGTILSETEKVVMQVLDKIEDYEEVIGVNYTIGSGGGGMSFSGSSSDTASISLKLLPKGERARSSNDIAVDMSKALSDVAGADITANASASAMGGGAMGESGVSFELKGDDLDVLKHHVSEISKLVKDVPGVSSVKTSIEEGSPQATIKVDRVKASTYGISASNVSSIISTAVTGTVATTYKISGDEYDVRLVRDRSNLDYITDVQNILIPASTGINVPLYEIATIEIEEMPVSIQRRNQEKIVTISAKLEGDRTAGEVSKDIENLVLKDYILPSGYTWSFGGSIEQMQEAFGGLGLALIMSLFLVYMIMAGQFESLMFPLIVMFSIPIALTGGIFGLFVMGDALSITSFLGLIMLSGIVLNTAIVLIDYANLLIRTQGFSVAEGLARAGRVRLRPILMTTITTVLGLIPIMLSGGEGSELMKGLSVVVVFGLSLSTLVTLFLIPALYLIFNNIKGRFLRKKSN